MILATKGMKERFWPMREGGPYGPERQVFKCTGCGAETAPASGWNGEPNKHHCRQGCPCQAGDLRIGASGAYRRNFDRVFPHAPGAGL
jgi:hypothetical protein